jgi:hypothetical protein
MYIQDYAGEPARPRQQPHTRGQPEGHQHERGVQEQPPGAEDQEEPEALPSIAPAAEVRRAVSAVGGERDGDFGHTHPHHRRLDQHLQGELHPRGLQFQRLDGGLPESSLPAIEIPARVLEEQLAHRRQERIAEIPVQGRHRPGLDPSPEPVAHHQIIPFTQLLDEWHQIAKIVAVVAVRHDDVTSSGCGDPTGQRGAIASLGDP